MRGLSAITKERRRFGARLRELRMRTGLTQMQLGARAGLTGKSIGEIERGGNTTLDALLGIATALGIHPSALFGTGSPDAPSGRHLTMAELDRARAAVKVLARALGGARKRRVVDTER